MKKQIIILEHGRPKGFVEFHCQSCGCRFKAGPKEYSSVGSVSNPFKPDVYTCYCPECGFFVPAFVSEESDV